MRNFKKNLHFEKLDNDEKELFQSWPILKYPVLEITYQKKITLFLVQTQEPPTSSPLPLNDQLTQSDEFLLPEENIILSRGKDEAALLKSPLAK